MADIRPPKRIFVIGPMTRGAKDAQGRPLSRHIPNIVEATERALAQLAKKHGAAMRKAEVITPPKRASGIPRGVFSHIMHCDFAIADISNASPNVIYELAMLHALGTPVILIGDPIFYLNHQNCVEVADFKMSTIRDALLDEGQLEDLMLAAPLEPYFNPITEYFDGVHMVNVAAAAGVATGQYYNFLRFVLGEGGMFRENPEIECLILLKPRHITEVDECIGRLEREFGTEKVDDNGKSTFALGKLNMDDNRHPRGFYFAYRIGNIIVDYPTPISSLRLSRQVLAMNDYQKGVDQLSAETFKTDFERRLIDVYFQTLEDLATRHLDGANWKKVKILDIDAAEKFLQKHLSQIS